MRVGSVQEKSGLRANVRLRSGLRLRKRSVHYVRVGGQRVQLRGHGSERLRGMPVRIGKLPVRRQVRQVLRLHDMRGGLDQSRKGRPLLLQVNTRRPLLIKQISRRTGGKSGQRINRYFGIGQQSFDGIGNAYQTAAFFADEQLADQGDFPRQAVDAVKRQ